MTEVKYFRKLKKEKRDDIFFKKISYYKIL